MTRSQHTATVRRATAAQPAPVAVQEAQPAEWDDFVAQHPQGHLLQQAPWGSLKASFEWDVQRIIIIRGGEAAGPAAVPVAGAQILFRQRYGVCAVYVPRGPLLAGDQSVDDLLLATLERRARRRRAVFLRVEPNVLEDHPQANALHTWLLLHGFQPVDPIQPRSTIHVDLTPAPEQLFASFSKGHRADIRRAERQGVTVRTGTAEDVPHFYQIMQATGQRAAFGIHSEAYYRLAWHLLQPRSCLLLAEQDGQVVAAHLVFADQQRGCYLYSGALEAGLKAGANHLLQWEALQWARAQGCTHYDLWGVPDALGRAATATDEQQRDTLNAEAQHNPLIGVYRFKKGFGGSIVRYLPAYDRVYLSPLYALWRRKMGG